MKITKIDDANLRAPINKGPGIMSTGEYIYYLPCQILRHEGRPRQFFVSISFCEIHTIFTISDCSAEQSFISTLGVFKIQSLLPYHLIFRHLYRLNLLESINVNVFDDRVGIARSRRWS